MCCYNNDKGIFMKKEKPQNKIESTDIVKKESAIAKDIVTIPTRESPESIQSATILMDDNYKRRKTVLSNRQIPKLTTLDVLGQLYDIVFLQLYVDDYAEWRTSGDKGRGRQDITDIFKFNSLHEHDKSKELLGLLGRR